MPYSTNGRNTMLDGIDTTHLSVHDGIPDDSGSNEISGGTPAYARKAVTFDAAAGGTKAKDASVPEFDVPAGTTVFFIGQFDALTVGNHSGFSPINGGEVDGVASVADTGDLLTAPGHGLVDDDRVYLRDPVGNAIPAGLLETVIYHVISVAGNNFQLSLTQGGGAVVITADGQAYFQKVIPETFASQGKLQVSVLTLKMES